MISFIAKMHTSFVNCQVIIVGNQKSSSLKSSEVDLIDKIRVNVVDFVTCLSC